MSATQETKDASPVLRYQRDRSLADVPAYSAGLQLHRTTGERIYLAMSATELALYGDDDRAAHYDLEGRLVKIAEANQYWRLGLSQRVLVTRKRTEAEGGGVERILGSPDLTEALVAAAQQRAMAAQDDLVTGRAEIEFAKPDVALARQRIEPLLARAAQNGVAAARQQANRFREVYGRVAVLPPDQYNALVVQATTGCAYGHCSFCELYRGVPFHRHSPAELRAHLEAVLALHGEAARTRRSIFLGEANALALEQPALEEIFGVLGEYFEFAPCADNGPAVSASWWLGQPRRFDGVSSFLDVFTAPQHTANEFAALRDRGLRRVYVGMESGDDALLRWLRKPARAAAVGTTVCALKEAGLAVGLIILLGAGGRGFADAHVRETVAVLNALPLGRGDFIYFSPLVIQSDGMFGRQMADADFERLSDVELRQQEQAMRGGFRFDPRRGRPYLARYELEPFVY